MQMAQWVDVLQIWMRPVREAVELHDVNPGCPSSIPTTAIVWHEQLLQAYRIEGAASSINQMPSSVFGVKRNGAMREGSWPRNCSH